MGGARDSVEPRRATILVVDDVDINRILLREALVDTHDVLEAEDGASALEVVRTKAVDLVLLDVMMPGLNGYEVCREIKARTREAFVPVLLVTALHEQESRNAGLEAGADDFLTKPVDPRELALRVRAFLRLREQERLIRHQVAQLHALDELKNDLFSLVVHDLRNPLAGVVGFLELLADPSLPIDRSYAAKALASARRLAELVTDVLSVTQLESGQVSEVHRVPTDVAQLVRDAAATLEGDARARGITVVIAPGAAIVAPVDPKLFRRAVENVLGNALKYSPPGGTVDVTVRQEGPLVVEVADRGPGVPAPLHGAIFEKFASVEARRGKARRGVGLGLHLVKLVAEAHGGVASVRDREGGGAVFQLSIPRGSA